MPMQDLLITFLLASALRSASASCSRRGAGSGRSAGRRIAAGTVWSISWSRLSAPMVASMAAISLAQGPMWRPMNSSCCSRAERGRKLMADSVSQEVHGQFPAECYPPRGLPSGRAQPEILAKIESSGGVGDGLVGGGVEQGVDIGCIVRGHLEQPGGVGVLVDRFRRVGSSLVHLGDGATDRSVDVSGGLDRFNDGDFLFGSVMGADFRQFNENEVAEGFLGMVGNADGDGAVSVDQDPLVGGGVLQIGRDVRHGFLLNGLNLDDCFAVAGEYGF